MKDYTEPFVEIWDAHPKREGDDPKYEAFICYKARLREGLPHDLILQCVKNYSDDVRRRGKLGTEGVLMLRTFLGKNRRWESYLPKADPPKPPRAAVEAQSGTPEERPDPAAGRAFVRDLISGLAKARTSPVQAYREKS